MKNIRTLLFLLLQCFCISIFAQNNDLTLKLIETTDVHGNFLGYDFMKDSPINNGLNKVYSYVKSQRELLGENQVFKIMEKFLYIIIQVIILYGQHIMLVH